VRSKKEIWERYALLLDLYISVEKRIGSDSFREAQNAQRECASIRCAIIEIEWVLSIPLTRDMAALGAILLYENVRKFLDVES